MCDNQVVFAVVDGNMYYRIYQKARNSTYRCELCGLDRYHYSTGHSSLQEARRWVDETLTKIQNGSISVVDSAC